MAQTTPQQIRAWDAFQSILDIRGMQYETDEACAMVVPKQNTTDDEIVAWMAKIHGLEVHDEPDVIIIFD